MYSRNSAGPKRCQSAVCRPFVRSSNRLNPKHVEQKAVRGWPPPSCAGAKACCCLGAVSSVPIPRQSEEKFTTACQTCRSLAARKTPNSRLGTPGSNPEKLWQEDVRISRRGAQRFLERSIVDEPLAEAHSAEHWQRRMTGREMVSGCVLSPGARRSVHSCYACPLLIQSLSWIRARWAALYLFVVVVVVVVESVDHLDHDLPRIRFLGEWGGQVSLQVS